MFYSETVLAKKSVLGKVWLAAHWDRRLNKKQIAEIKVFDSSNEILKHPIKLSLRTSGHLLLGVVRIYSRQAKYLLADCSDALVKLRMVYRTGRVDLPADASSAAFSAITLPANARDMDFLVADVDFDALDLQTSAITEVMRGANDGNADYGFDSEFGPADESTDHHVAEVMRSAPDDDEETTAFDRRALALPTKNVQERGGDDYVDDTYFYGEDNFGANDGDVTDFFMPKESMADESDLPGASEAGSLLRHSVRLSDMLDLPSNNQTLLEPMSMSMEASVLDTSAAPAPKPALRTRANKRKLVVDNEITISTAQMKAQLANSDNIVQQSFVPAPLTKRQMRVRQFELAGPSSLFNNPAMFATVSPLLLQLLERAMNDDRTSSDDRTLRKRDAGAADTSRIEPEQMRDHERPATPARYPDQAMSATDDSTTVGDVPFDDFGYNDDGDYNQLEPETAEEREQRLANRREGAALMTEQTRKSRRQLEDEMDEDQADDEGAQARKQAADAPEELTRRELNEIFEKQDEMSFKEHMDNATRSKAAEFFVHLLHLRVTNHLEISQGEPYGDIVVKPGVNFAKTFARALRT
ncbi:hypothetical protein CAOG_06272 [Capsaspora owczarzaki ATCC 30864]|uniref:Double-strand-break repair protein rad21 n=1 Tax=Capsaspora owczarzaki (strain ATCC 30864) TaxID=595528 RepID=A0A0D2X4D5_CAPO3|nr:hypothetical protein CAOG_06272 [Capsaspora owczarzaki ATCC 30864]KJE95869.1 hypothetical protein CAOG_006272 [Capsaspora owczarzaki ATCC 30864]|eukprot:XP_004345021.2 hypothetical protein CAOG_06272 [Capsaspora owczarzaki ATCC 30864]